MVRGILLPEKSWSVSADLADGDVEGKIAFDRWGKMSLAFCKQLEMCVSAGLADGDVFENFANEDYGDLFRCRENVLLICGGRCDFFF